jgi:hypothetical protein
MRFSTGAYLCTLFITASSAAHCVGAKDAGIESRTVWTNHSATSHPTYIKNPKFPLFKIIGSQFSNALLSHSILEDCSSASLSCNADPDPSFQFNEDPPRLHCMRPRSSTAPFLSLYSSCILTAMRIRIQFFTLMRIRIQLPMLIRIRNPEHNLSFLLCFL